MQAIFNRFQFKKVITLLMITGFISGCGILDSITYKIPKQQGNITQEADFNKLEIGMTREQVRFVMGTPMSVDTFDINRWDYLYTFNPGHGPMTIHHLTLRFKDNQLVEIIGKPLQQTQIDEDSAEQSESDKNS